MVISMKPEIFAIIHPDTFVIPTNPGPAPDPDAIAAASTATKIADLYRLTPSRVTFTQSSWQQSKYL